MKIHEKVMTLVVVMMILIAASSIYFFYLWLGSLPTT